MGILVYPRKFTEMPPLMARINQGHPLARGLTGCWLLNDAGGLTTFDSCSKNNGTISAATWSGNGLVFTVANTSKITLAQNASPAALPGSIMALVRLTNLTQRGRIIDMDGGTNYAGFWFEVSTAGLVEIAYGSNTGTTSASRRSGVGAIALSAGSMYNVVGVIRGATDMSIYVNGNADSPTYSGTAASYVAGSTAGFIGVSYSENTWSYSAETLYMVAAWDRVITANEAAWLYERPYAFFEMPRRYWVGPAVVGGLSIPIAQYHYMEH